MGDDTLDMREHQRELKLSLYEDIKHIVDGYWASIDAPQFGPLERAALAIAAMNDIRRLVQ